MTMMADVLSRLEAIGVTAHVDGADVVLKGSTDRIPGDLMASVRRGKAGLVTELLRRKAQELAAFIDGDAPLAERLARAREYQETAGKLAEAQQRLFDSLCRAGFTVMWSPVVEEFVVVGDGNPPAGSDGYVVYTWAEAEALKDATPEQVREAHKVKKAFAGKVIA